MLDLKTKADLQRLVDEGLEESLILDYKASPALSKESKARDELCKDVSAMANSAGGQIVYGIEEKNQKPVRVDDGNSVVSREWIEQVIDSNVQPRIQGLIITPIKLETGYSYVITIPQSTSRGAHQAPDKKYYKRQNFQSSAMEDYEIRDIMRRTTRPDLFLKLLLPRGDNASIQLGAHQELSEPLALRVAVGNNSDQPAFHVVVQIAVSTEITISESNGYDRMGVIHQNGNPKHALSYSIISPPNLPIFKEIDVNLPAVLLRFPSSLLQSVNRLPIAIKTVTPGNVSDAVWYLHQEGQHLRLLPPQHPLNR
ncbi:hypothetical protein C2U70_23885 [Bradyrhizobium guangdongense]|uniref:AlbA family DNA-binding domain-containing protein n=1 Tax=Bradyrhizobium guangdongense TaxID=1325090 RepID=UPI00112AC18F|nr:ATP-binding protein [Bradyrhizobium guangdongense]TPQ31542.1 hypothetical protein C2U70_23885 [Bradyrhizobium guangdongense]